MDKTPLIKSIITKENLILEVAFDNGITKTYDCNKLIEQFDWYEDLKLNDLFHSAYIDCGGHGVTWNEDIDVSECELWDNGITVDKK